MTIKPNIFLTLAFATVLVWGCNKHSSPNHNQNKYSGEIIARWNVLAYESMGGLSYQHSLLASRINAMTHIAMHDAVNAANPVYQSYIFTEKDYKADPFAAAASAAHTVLVASFPDKKIMLDAELEQSLIQVKDADAKQKGIVLGKKAAESILASRAGDGADKDPIGGLEPASKPGDYKAVPPANFIFAPHWKIMKLFSLQKHDQFRSAPHPALESAQYAADFEEVKNIGKIDSKIRTADQGFYAKFWYEFSEAGWNRVTRTVAAGRQLDLQASARLFALVNIALADAYTAGWDAKFHYNFWRPYTAIHEAANDGNNSTIADTQWQSAEGTPPVQDYPSTHSALGNAAATVLAGILGDNTSFTMPSPSAIPVNATRSFTSFSKAANENADSRVMAGIHFRFACKAGQELGNKVGKWTLDNHLKPLHQVVNR